MSAIPLLLLQPTGACREFTRSGSCYPPLGLCQLAAMIPPSMCEVLDADGLGLTDEETVDAVLARNPGAVGLTLTTYTCAMIERITVPLANAGLDILIGGPQATLAPQRTLELLPHVRWVFCGEAELQMEEMVKRLSRGEDLAGVPGILARKEAQQVERQTVDEFDNLPFPRYEGLPLDAYWCPDAKNKPMVTVMTTRGCPHRCGFCSSPALLGRKVRGWSVGKILDHLQFLHDVHGIREISFVDDVFTINRRRLVAICDGMVERGLKLSWFCNSRADQVNKDVATAAARAGCHQMYLGFESGHPRLLELINKDATIDELVAGADILREYGINRSIGFVIGLPTENQETVEASLELARRVRPERIQFTRWTPLVASPLESMATPNATKTFHSNKDEQDKIDRWIRRLYQSVEPEPWGATSW